MFRKRLKKEKNGVRVEAKVDDLGDGDEVDLLHQARNQMIQRQERKVNLKDKVVGINTEKKKMSQTLSLPNVASQLSFQDEENHYAQQHDTVLQFQKKSFDASACEAASKSSLLGQVTAYDASGDYSKDNMDALKQEQLYQLPQKSPARTLADKVVVEDIDMPGDQAEEDGNVDEIEEDFIALKHGNKKSNRNKKRIRFAEKLEEVREFSTVDATENESDGEENNATPREMNPMDEWEMEQIRRGSRQSNWEGLKNLQGTYQGEALEVISLEKIVLHLKKSAAELKEDIEKSDRDSLRLHAELDTTSAQIQLWKSQLNLEGGKFECLQDLRGYLTDVCYCMREKLPDIEKVELAIEDHRRRVYETRREKLQRFLEDELWEIASRQSLLSKFDFSVEQQDDFAGRDMTYYNENQRQQRREKRIQRRQCMREKSIGVTSQVDGKCSDISSEDEVEGERKQKLREASDLIFEDVKEEYQNLSMVLFKIAQWRNLYLDSYKDAFVSLALVKIIEPFVRLEMIHWNPLEKPLVLSELKWLDNLLVFGAQAACEADDEIAPAIMENVVVSKLIEAISNLVLSSRKQNQCLISSIHELVAVFSMISKDAKSALQNSVVRHFQKELMRYEVPLVVMADASAVEVSDRQFCRSLRVIENCLLWKQVDVVVNFTRWVQEVVEPFLDTKLTLFVNNQLEYLQSSTRNEPFPKSRLISLAGMLDGLLDCVIDLHPFFSVSRKCLAQLLSSYPKDLFPSLLATTCSKEELATQDHYWSIDQRDLFQTVQKKYESLQILSRLHLQNEMGE